MQNDDQTSQPQQTELQGVESQPVEGVPVPPMFMQPDPPKKKRSKKVVAAIMIVLLVVLTAGGYLAYTQLTPGKETKAALVSPSPEAKSQPPQAPDVAAVVASVREKLSDVAATNDDAYASVSHKTSGGYWVRLDGDKERIKFVELSYSDVKSNLADLSTAKKALDAEGIKKIVDTGDVSDEVADYQGHFASDAIVCSITNGGRGDFDGASNKMRYASYVLTLGCAKATDFNDNIAALKPLAPEIKRASFDPSNADLVLFDPTIVKSPVKGYANASVGAGGVVAYVGGYQALLYQIPDGSWHYFLGTQNSLECSEFNTVDIKRAFAGYECYEGEALTKVVAP